MPSQHWLSCSSPHGNPYGKSLNNYNLYRKKIILGRHFSRNLCLPLSDKPLPHGNKGQNTFHRSANTKQRDQSKLGEQDKPTPPHHLQLHASSRAGSRSCRNTDPWAWPQPRSHPSEPGATCRFQQRKVFHKITARRQLSGLGEETIRLKKLPSQKSKV